MSAAQTGRTHDLHPTASRKPKESLDPWAPSTHDPTQTCAASSEQGSGCASGNENASFLRAARPHSIVRLFIFGFAHELLYKDRSATNFLAAASRQPSSTGYKPGPQDEVTPGNPFVMGNFRLTNYLLTCDRIVSAVGGLWPRVEWCR